MSQVLQEERLDDWYNRIKLLREAKLKSSARIAQYVREDDVRYRDEREVFKAYCHEIKYLRKKIAKDIEQNGIRWGYICPQ